jgi:cell division protein ZapE
MDYFHKSLRHNLSERTHFYRFMREVHGQLRALAGRSDPLEAVAEQLAQRLRLICLDEFFVADIADAMILAGLFAGLFRRGVTLVATSNVQPRNLYKDGLQRARFLPAIDLIERHVQVVHLDGGIDYRLRQLEQAPTYMDATLPDTAAAFRARFAQMAGDAAAERSVLQIEDRPITAIAAAPGLAWFDFPDICEGPRSQNDYIEIARTFHTVFISNVPIFTAESEDAARRFIMLIDEFYDRSVNLVVSAAAAPAALYRGEKLAFEFERASSRLIEMQTEAYLSGAHRP